MGFTLGLNLNPFVNRFAEPDDLVAALAGEIGIGHVQLVHEFIDPSWPEAVRRRLTESYGEAFRRHGIAVTSMMTGPYGRLNHFGHPDAEVRAHHLAWFKGMVDIAAGLGCPAVGTQYAILTYRDQDDPARRDAIMAAALDCWRALADHAALRGLGWLFWEPMSVARELGHTLAATDALQASIDAAGLAVPLRPMVDIDHGDVASADPADTDPFAWAERFATRSPIIHIKQSSRNKGGHWPFTAQYNEDGRITPDALLEAVRRGGGSDNELCLELAFREREPTDRSVVAAVKESVAYWRPHVDAGLEPRP